jgi:glycerol kinase
VGRTRSGRDLGDDGGSRPRGARGRRRRGGDLAGVGIANQRETALLWEAGTGTPVANAIVWQDRRTTDRIEELEAAGKTDWIRETTGLEPDAYFSATKFEWLFENAGEELRERARDGEVLAGTVDSWLAYNLTSASAHVTDVTNASRTMLFDVRDLEWDDDLLEEFGVPRACLPEVRPSIDEGYYGRTDPDGPFCAEVPVAAALGDQQAALFGQTCFEPGEAKNTTGTGSFVLMNTGTEPVASEHGLLTTVAFQRSGESPVYAFEGSIFVTGGAIEWLGDLSLVDDPGETERLATAVDSTGDVYVVPAFAGLGAPHWDGRARGTIVGLTRATRREHVVRAALEAIAFRTRDVVDAMAADADLDLDVLRVDGGAVENDALCQFQADVLGTRVLRPVVDETTALGAAYAVGLATGYWDDRDALREHWRVDREFDPEVDRATADQRYGRWEQAVERSLDWARD